MIPDLELELFTTISDRAVSCAGRGDFAGGHGELLNGLERAASGCGPAVERES
jgi:hypothetical protein